MKSTATSERDTKDPVSPADFEVVIVWHEEVDAPRARRIANILSNILDNTTTPGEGERDAAQVRQT